MWKNTAEGSLVALVLALALTAGCAADEPEEPMMDMDTDMAPAEAAPPPAAPPPAMADEMTLTGCLLETDDGYALAVTEAAGDIAAGTRVAAMPAVGVSFTGHVSHTVNLTGTLTDDDPPAMNVTAMQHVSGECAVPPAPMS